MKIAREAHRAIVLDSGKVLITGGLSPVWPQQRNDEIYDPATGDFSFAGEMTVSRADHRATLLSNGQVLLSAGSTGRSINEAVTETTEVYDPSTNRFTASGNLSVPRHKLYDPDSGRFSPTGSMRTARFKIRDAPVLLANGRVLIAGGGMRLEVYDPARGAFTARQQNGAHCRWLRHRRPAQRRRLAV